MNSIDKDVFASALRWSEAGHQVWLCTVLSTFGSSPRPPGSVFAAIDALQHTGSLSGGCVEEAFLEQLERGCFASEVAVIAYGDGGEDSRRLGLPCGGVLKVLVERLAPTQGTLAHLQALQLSLAAQQRLIRRVGLDGGRALEPDRGQGAAVEFDGREIRVRVGPVTTLLLAGISPVAEYCAQFALALGFEVLVCDPRDDARQRFDVPGAQVLPLLPSLHIARNGCHSNTAVVALTHDPKIDDLAMMEAVRTDAFYIGVMGSTATSAKRTRRLLSTGGLSDVEVARIRMPVGLPIGSKTPAEIALSVMADIISVRSGIG
ncbi:XdhC family protein [Marinobacterium sedimentorum]|uniref:XdhC family protein n=1 Tax=Marinobacterium sedimentorum TaxID=2927804 RepID=UPI0020C5DBE8|nr:XdhC family protein [Marinobacterium sedimentorum]MCP8687717.1 XdhC family protein [Marinobacterium sedimentorum]